MMLYSRRIKRVAVLGAGVMGAQIAAQLANAGLSVTLFELPAKGKNKNANVVKALEGLIKIKPSPLASQSTLESIELANYEQHLPQLKACDLIIEAITEQLDLKHALYQSIVPYLHELAVLATNTSGISIHKLAEVLPQVVRQRFCGLHFFNPPRYMHLLELIPQRDTDPKILDVLEGFLTTILGKGVIRARDTPSFIGNRIGVFSLLAVIHHAGRLGLAPDLVDKLTGPGIGRPWSATFRTLDMVGLDTIAHVVRSLAENTEDDPWNSYYQLPLWLQQLVEKGALGQKTGIGIYQKSAKDIQVFDPQNQDYRRVRSALDEEVRKILLIPQAAKKIEALLDYHHPQAEFLLSIFLDLFHFCAIHLREIAATARDIDLAMRWGYGWEIGPFETWQAAGWQRISTLIDEKLAKGEMMSSVPLPDWVTDPNRVGVHGPEGSWSVSQERMVPRSNHSVYARQRFPMLILGEPRPATETLFETDAVRLWHDGDQIAVLSFKTKMHTASEGVLEGSLRAVRLAEESFKALVIWQPQAPFCAGANLLEIISAVKAKAFAEVEDIVGKFQQATWALKHSAVPTVAAVQGLALGGGCEFLMHCDRVVGALESYIGLVEVGVGLVPAGGGCKELASRAAEQAKGGDLFSWIARYFEQVALGKVSLSATEASEWGYLRAADKIVLNPYELLHVAKHEALSLFEGGYRPPSTRRNIPVAGAAGIANLQVRLVNLREGGFISKHDYEIGLRLASILCGGDVDPGSMVNDEWLLRLELEALMDLIKMEKTQARIQHMLEQGKPLRN